jgi:N-acetylneuraminic acid mutarotase
VVIGGGNATEQSVVQERGEAGWHVLGHLPGPRSDLTAVTGHDVTYVVGGYDGRSAALADVLATLDGRRWRIVSRLPVPVRYAAVALVGRTLWVFGGEVDHHMVRFVQRVDLKAGAARVAGRLPVAAGHSVAVRVGARVLLVGGRSEGGKVTSRMWWFRPGRKGFRAAGHLPTPLADTAVLDIGGSAYLVGGETPALSDRVLRLSWGRP